MLIPRPRSRRKFCSPPAAILVACVGAVALAANGAGPAHAASDPLADQQWHLDTIGTPSAWSVTRGAGVTIAVVDSGVDLDHEDLRARVGSGTTCLATQNDPGACSGTPEDDNGHGTHVSGIAVATAGNGVGVAGVAPEARLMPIRALEHVCQTAVNAPGGETCGATGNSADTGAAIRWAVDHGADIVNLSLGEPIALRVEPGTQLGDEIEYAWSKGVIVVGAAGNDFDIAVGSHYGNLPLVVVAATGPDDSKAAYSNTVGEVRWGVAAPGGAGVGDCPGSDILATTWQPTGENNAYGCMAGTSMAAPVVSGALALLRASGLSPQAAVKHLLETADDIGPPGVDTQFGHGRINLAGALSAAKRSSGSSSGTSGGGSSGGGSSGAGSSAGGTQQARPSPAPSSSGSASTLPSERSTPASSEPGRPVDATRPPDNGDGSGSPGMVAASRRSNVPPAGAALAVGGLAFSVGLLLWRQRRRRTDAG